MGGKERESSGRYLDTKLLDWLTLLRAGPPSFRVDLSMSVYLPYVNRQVQIDPK